MDHKINICYICNDSFAIQTGVSILSLIANHDQKCGIRIFLIDAGITDINLRKIQNICNSGHVELILYQPKELIIRLKNIIYPKKEDERYLTMALRLFLGEILPDDVEHVLYLDGDTIVEHPLTKLFFGIFQQPIAAVIDANFDYNFTLRQGYEKGNYFNAGVLLINLKKYRKLMKADKILPILEKRPLFNDQDVLNILFRNNFFKLLPEYNATLRYRLLKQDALIRWMNWKHSPYTKNQLNKARCYPTIIHYTWSTLGRPWEKGSLDPDKERWIFYFEQSPWKKTKLNVPTISKKKKLIRVLYQHCSLNLFMAIEYLYFKHSFLNNKKL